MVDVGRGREELRLLFRAGKIQLEPRPDRSYIARAMILPLGPTPKSRTPTLEFIEGRRHGSVGCGGPIHSLYTAISLPFEVVIPFPRVGHGSADGMASTTMS